MTIVEMILPRTGEAVDSARLVSWMVSPGQPFRTGDVLLEVETDKSIIEVPAHQDGVMVEHLVEVDGLLNPDTPIARIETDEEPAAAPASVEPPRAAQPETKAAAAAASHAPAAAKSTEPPGREAPRTASSHARKFATPAARRLARESGVAIESVNGTGPGARVTRADLVQRLPASGARSRTGDAAPAPSPGMRELLVPTSYGDVSMSVWDAPSSAGRPTVVLLHGMFGDASTWASLAHAMNRAGCRVFALDLPCHGKTLSVATSFSDIVEATAEVIAQHCPGSISLIGHSFGGAVAIKVAAKPNSGVRSLALIAPVGAGVEINQGFLDGMVHGQTNEALMSELTKLTVAGMTPSMAYVDELRLRIAARRDRLVELCRQVATNGVQRLGALPDLARLQCPTVVIHGRRDGIIPWQQVLDLPPRVALHLVPDAGHMPQWEATRLTTDIVLDLVLR